jgi:hypothetical protein
MDVGHQRNVNTHSHEALLYFAKGTRIRGGGRGNPDYFATDLHEAQRLGEGRLHVLLWEWWS